VGKVCGIRLQARLQAILWHPCHFVARQHDRHLPNLDVAGSSPVSRSMFSITCVNPFHVVLRLFSVHNQYGAKIQQAQGYLLHQRAPIDDHC
jgi:hypothetical protein